MQGRRERIITYSWLFMNMGPDLMLISRRMEGREEDWLDFMDGWTYE